MEKILQNFVSTSKIGFRRDIFVFCQQRKKNLSETNIFPLRRRVAKKFNSAHKFNPGSNLAVPPGNLKGTPLFQIKLSEHTRAFSEKKTFKFTAILKDPD